MKKIYCLIFLGLTALWGFGQTPGITLYFLAEDIQTHDYLAIDNVIVQNLDSGGDTTLFGIIPKITLAYPVGINENELNGAESFRVTPGVPNPFSGSTVVSIYLPKEGNLNLVVSDILGRKISEYRNEFSRGIHRFRISSSQDRMLILFVYDEISFKSLKLISKNNGAEMNSIEYLGSLDIKLKNAGDINNINGFVFHGGDQLSFQGKVSGYNDEILTDRPGKDSVYTFFMTPVSQLATVTTNNISDIS
ncbi:MAG: hypothetical protein WCI71_15135, partial [Bacteroidota bacterium]